MIKKDQPVNYFISSNVPDLERLLYFTGLSSLYNLLLQESTPQNLLKFTAAFLLIQAQLLSNHPPYLLPSKTSTERLLSSFNHFKIPTPLSWIFMNPDSQETQFGYTTYLYAVDVYCKE